MTLILQNVLILCTIQWRHAVAGLSLSKNKLVWQAMTSCNRSPDSLAQEEGEGRGERRIVRRKKKSLAFSKGKQKKVLSFFDCFIQ